MTMVRVTNSQAWSRTEKGTSSEDLRPFCFLRGFVSFVLSYCLGTIRILQKRTGLMVDDHYDLTSAYLWTDD